jgi:hypothetical protein
MAHMAHAAMKWICGKRIVQQQPSLRIRATSPARTHARVLSVAVEMTDTMVSAMRTVAISTRTA